jgi:N-acetylglucosamine-6-sulfatase
MAKKGQRSSAKKKVSRLQIIFYIVLAFAIPLSLYLVSKQTDNRTRAAGPDAPNIIVIMTDDQRYDEMETLPTITGRVASRGATFTNGFITNPLCCPSRASFLSSLYSHNTNVWGNNGEARGGYGEFRDNEAQTIAVWLQNAGYKTGLFGKYMNGYDKPNVPIGWSTWVALVGGQDYYNYKLSINGSTRKFGSGSNNYITDVIRDQAVKFITETPEPFFLLFTSPSPHNPRTIAPRYKGTCADLPSWQVPPSFNEADVSDKPRWVQKLSKKSESTIQAERVQRLCSLKAVDEAIAKMLDTLEADGRLENTVVIFYTDNGWSAGEHRHLQKRCFYEACIRTPFVISYPKLFPGGKTIDGFALNIDLAPTIAELAGVTIPVNINGRSLVPLLTGSTESVRDEILLEVQNQDQNFRGTGIRTKEYKYIELESGEKELYNLTLDPYELENQIKNPAYQSVIQDLAVKLAVIKAE